MLSSALEDEQQEQNNSSRNSNSSSGSSSIDNNSIHNKNITTVLETATVAATGAVPTATVLPEIHN